MASNVGGIFSVARSFAFFIMLSCGYVFRLFFFLRSVDQDRAWGVTHNLVGGAAD